MRREVGEDGAGENVSADRAAVAQHAVVEEVHGAAVVDAQQGTVFTRPLGDRDAGFQEVDVACQVGERNVRVDIAVLVEKCAPEAAVLEAERGGGFASLTPPPPFDFLDWRL